MAAQSSKELVKDLFGYKELLRTPFIPWVGVFAAKLEQVPVRGLLSDAGTLSKAQLNAQKLFGSDAIVNIFDTSLEAEACGCRLDWSDKEAPPKVSSHPLSEGAAVASIDVNSIESRGRLPAVIEATKRMLLIKGKDMAVFAMMTGPLTLARHLVGKTFIDSLVNQPQEAAKAIGLAGSIGSKLCRTYGELGVDAIVVADETLGEIPPELVKTAVGPLKTIWNMTRYYGIHSLLVTKGCSAGHIEPVISLEAEGVAIGGVDCAAVKEAVVKKNRVYGGSILSSALLESPEKAGASAAECLAVRGKGFFLTTEWDIPYATPVENMHEVAKALKATG